MRATWVGYPFARMAGSCKKPPQAPIQSAAAYAAPIIEYSCTVTLQLDSIRWIYTPTK
jgi:hypothetical protein